MEKKTASGLLLILLMMGMLTLAFNIQPVSGSGTIYIRPNGSVEGTDKIQQDGDVYTFIDNIYDSIVVQKDNIVVDGAVYTVQGAGAYGIDLTGRSNVTIKNMEIKAFYFGIYLSGSSSNTISGNNITENVCAVRLDYSSNNNMTGNNITNNQYGICLWVSSNNTVGGNKITKNLDSVELCYSPNSIIVGNNITNNGDAGVRLYSSSSSIIAGNNITDNLDGVLHGGSSNNTISGNNITANIARGVELGESSNNSVVGNSIANNGNGIGFYVASSNYIFGNNISINNDWGFLLQESSNNSISGNNITANQGSGIYLIISSNNNIIGNNITNNSPGILLAYYSNNKFYHNNFIGNALQVYDLSWDDPDISPSICDWDDGYPSGGNYWSDYAGVDANSDGIGDSPYVIDENNQDRFPLMNPWCSAERIVGVEIGSWVKYSNFDISWSSNDPDATMPSGLSILREVEWWENSVEDILDSKIRYQQLLHFRDGSEYSTTCWIDIDTGSGTPLSFVSSGLVSDDCVYASAPWYAWKINETISHMCAGVNRETNHLNVTTSMQVGPPPACRNTTGNFYWDKETGVLCELSMRHLNQTESYVTSWSVFYEIVDTNLWKAPVVSASVGIDPDTLHLKGHGRWITAYIQLPEGYNPADIDATTILLNDTFAPVLDPKYGFVTDSSEYLVDHNNDGILERMVKFDRATVASWIYQSVGMQYGDIPLTITGQLTDGTPFEGTTTIFAFWQGHKPPCKR